MFKIKLNCFWYKLTNWEFWNFGLVYFFVKCYYFLLSIRSGSFLFFTASNPGIENSGFIGESKSSILEKIPGNYIPGHFKIIPEVDVRMVLNRLVQYQIVYPFIAKPDVGERGRGVEKINNYSELIEYHKNIGVPYIIQEFIDFPVEAGIFYYRFPIAVKGVISSLVLKDFLKVKGDGHKTLKQLIEEYPRAALRIDYLNKKFRKSWNNIIPAGEVIELENIGNHVRGTTFLDGSAAITQKLRDQIDTIAHSISGFYYGRFDIRCPSVEDLKEGRNIKILELNGAGSEPGHIYQPGFSFLEGQKVLLKHWKVLYKISVMNHKAGVKYMSTTKAYNVVKQHKAALMKIGV